MLDIKTINNGKEIVLVKKENGCIECISHCKDENGYTRIMYRHKPNRLHRIIYELFYGEISNNMVVRHKCDNPSCCNIEHLELGTQLDNINDMIKRGRIHKGENNKLKGTNNTSNKLTNNQVCEIYLSNLSFKKIAEKYNISKTNVYLIKNKLSWKWLTDTLD